MNYGATKDDQGNIIGGLISETDGEIFEERRRVGAITQAHLQEIAAMKSKDMEKLEAKAEKLRALRGALVKEIQGAIRKELRELADKEGVSIDDDAATRPLNNEELGRIESVNLLLESTMRKQQEASTAFYTEQIKDIEKTMPKIEADIAAARSKLTECEDRLHKAKISKKKFRQHLQSIKDFPAVYQSPMRAHNTSTTEKLAALMRY